MNRDLELEIESPPIFTSSANVLDPMVEGLGPHQQRLRSLQEGIFGHGTFRYLEAIRKESCLAVVEGREPDYSGIPETLVLPSSGGKVCWPPRLMPWRSLLSNWESYSKPMGKEMEIWGFERLRNQFPHLRLTQSTLPEGFNPWLVSVGIDPGEKRDPEAGYTTLLLVAAPEEWTPKPVQALYGRSGEVDFVRLDGLVMRIPKAWWRRWAYMALRDHAVYFVAPEVDGNGGP